MLTYQLFQELFSGLFSLFCSGHEKCTLVSDSVMDYLWLWLNLWAHLPLVSLSYCVADLVDINQAASDDVIIRTVVQSKSQIGVEGWREAAKHTLNPTSRSGVTTHTHRRVPHLICRSHGLSLGSWDHCGHTDSQWSETPSSALLL